MKRLLTKKEFAEMLKASEDEQRTDELWEIALKRRRR